MFHLFSFNFIRQFSYLQQYLIITSFFFIPLYIFQYWWCLIFLPLSTFLAHWLIKRLSLSNQTPIKSSGYLYKFLRPANHPTDASIEAVQKDLEEEYTKYIKSIIGRYICIWYCPLISTDQDFLDQLHDLLLESIHRVNDRLKTLDTHELFRLIVNLLQKHVQQYLYAVDSYRKQHRQNRLSESTVEEFSRVIGFHPSLGRKDFHGYFRAFVELFFTEFLPEKAQIYSACRPAREILTQILVNRVFLLLFNEFSKPRMIYYLLTILLESDEQKNNAEIDEDASIPPTELADLPNEQESINLIDGRSSLTGENRQPSAEQIIYSATIISVDTAYNPMSGAAYTVYIIQCETKSPFVSNTRHRYTIQRRFREFTYLHKRLQQNHRTSQECYGDIQEIYRALPLGMDNMNPDIIRRRRGTLEQYIEKIISNEVLNSSHDVLEFFAFNSDPNIPFEPSPATKLPVPRVDKALLRTLSDVGTAITSLLPAKREAQPLRETFQLNVCVTYNDPSTVMHRLEHFNAGIRSILIQQSEAISLNSIDQDFLQVLLTRPSLVSNRKEKTESEIPLTDAVFNLIHTSLHSREAIISNESINLIVRTLFGHLIEEFLKSEIDEILAPERILEYLINLRTKVLWPNEDSPSKSIKHIKHRAYNAIINKIPLWLQYIAGRKNISRIVINLLECFSHEQLNRHFLFNAFDFVIAQIIPHISSREFLTKYVYMHAGSRS